ncbi:MAG: heme peroxidase family protein [Pyrinomonadaceae bacterium]
MIRRISPQRHGQSESLIRKDKKSSFTAVNEIIEGSANIGFDPIVSSINTFTGPGGFGRMFPTAAQFRPASDKGLINLAQKMLETEGDVAGANHPNLPAGFTYLGQFVDHDITFDKTIGLPVIADVATILQARTPHLDLDSLYGFGPGSDSDGEMFEGAKGSEVFKLGRTRNGVVSPQPAGFSNDLNRRTDTSAIIPDERNDENLIVAQTHLAFLKFHNKLISILPPSQQGEPSLFERAKEMVVHHYQWIVLHDFVRRLVKKEVFEDVLENGRKFYRFEEVGTGKPFMPIEFSVAAYRLGHSMIRARYDYNHVFRRAKLGELFKFTGNGGGAPIPSDWIIDWRRFYEVGDFGGVGQFTGINNTRLIDTKLADPLKDLTENGQIKVDNPPPALAERNLLRGSRLGLPTGQELAQIVNVQNRLTPDDIATGESAQVVSDNGFDKETPLWFYILKEAERRENGERLGELGSRIVAEVFIGLLQGDKNSILSQNWKPSDNDLIPKQNDNEFTMADLLLFVNDISPIDGLSG